MPAPGALAVGAMLALLALPLPVPAPLPPTPALPVEGAWAQAAFPYQSLGNRGTDVAALQLLLNQRGAALDVDGIFGPLTDAALRAWQESQGLAPDGIAGPLTWGRLVPVLGPGSAGDAVRALQRQLHEKAAAEVAEDGLFLTTTLDAVRAFQAHAGLPDSGIVEATTWRHLLWHFEPADTSRGTICGYSLRSERWGTGAAIGQLEAAAAAFAAQGKGRMSLGDVSLEHGGDIPNHKSHEVGLDADVRPVRLDKLQCSQWCTWDAPCYDRDGMRALLQALHAAAPGHVHRMWFNDPVLIAEGLATFLAGHDNHTHVRYCERGHANASYVCA